MSDNEIIPGVIAAAIAAAGPRGDNEAAWRAKINAAIPAIAAMMNPPEKDAKGSKQWQVASEVLGATVFTAEYVSHAIEESSTRVVVQLDSGKPSKNYPDGVEPIRTHRTDGAQGKAMLAKLKQLTAGDSVVVWKAMEAMSGAAAGEKARVLVHLETRPKWKRDENMTPAPARKAPPKAEPRTDDAPGDVDRPASGLGFAYAFNELGAKDKVAVVRILRDEGITFPEPQPDKTDRFLAVIDEVTT